MWHPPPCPRREHRVQEDRRQDEIADITVRVERERRFTAIVPEQEKPAE